MFASLDSRSPTPMYAQIASQVRLAILRGELAAGESLPSVRSVAAQLRINPATVVQAYRELERERIVDMKQGAGTFVADLADELAVGTRRTEARKIAQAAIDQATRAGISADDLRAAFDHELNGDSR